MNGLKVRRERQPPALDRPGLRVAWAKLGVLWWRDVPVLAAPTPELTDLDSFVVMATQRLGALDVALFEEITGLPAIAFHGLGRRLHSLGQLDLTGAVLRPRQPGAGPSVTPAGRRTVPSTMDFLYLPDTDDLIAVPTGLDAWERAVPRQPKDGMILSSSSRDVTVRTLLADRIAQGRVAGLPPDIIALDEGPDEPLAAMTRATPPPAVPVCPVVQCAASVVLTEDRPRVTLTVTRRSASRDDRPVEIDLTGAAGVVAQWCRLADRLAEPAGARQVVRAIGLPDEATPRLRRENPGSWRIPVTGEQARVLAAAGPLNAPIGLSVRDDRAKVVVAVRPEPADGQAEAMIQRDALVQELLPRLSGGGRLLGHHDRVVRDAGGPAAIRSRAWQLGYYALVHALRQEEDFGYV